MKGNMEEELKVNEGGFGARADRIDTYLRAHMADGMKNE
jgi:hypothetical protein